MKSLLPILTVRLTILGLWSGAAVSLKARWTLDQAARAGREMMVGQIVSGKTRQERPKLPAPHQVGAEFWKTTGAMALEGGLFQAQPDLSRLGCALGDAAGLCPRRGHPAGGGGIHNRAMDRSVMKEIRSPDAMGLDLVKAWGESSGGARRCRSGTRFSPPRSWSGWWDWRSRSRLNGWGLVRGPWGSGRLVSGR